jgi:hypothetical protein
MKKIRLRHKVRELTVKTDRLDAIQEQMDRLNKRLGLESLDTNRQTL